MSVRKNFAEVKEEIAVSAHNSNMNNLAHADRSIDEFLAELDKKKAEALALRAKIEALADDPDALSKDIWTVYQAVRDLRFTDK